WVITHQPSSKFAASPEAAFTDEGLDPEGVRQGKQLWLQQIQARPTDTRILYNAGRYFAWGDDWQQSQELMERAYAITPGNHEVASFLAGLYWRNASHSPTGEQMSAL